MIIGFMQYKENIKSGKMVNYNAASTGLDGTFKASCRGVAESDFPLLIVVHQRNPQIGHVTPMKVEFGDELTHINLPIRLSKGPRE